MSFLISSNENLNVQDELIDDPESLDDEKIPGLTELNKILFDEEEMIKYLISHDTLTTEGTFFYKSSLKVNEIALLGYL